MLTDRADASLDSHRTTAHTRWSAQDLAVIIGLLGLVAMLAALRWTGQVPFGSDHDEYRMLATALWEQGQPVIAGVEGSKYPFGYSLVLGVFEQLGLSMTALAMVVNLALVGVLVLCAWWIGRQHGRAPGAVAGLLVGVSPTLWDSVYVVMPDLALTAVTVAAFAWVLGLDDRAGPAWRVALVAAGVAVVAVGLKTFGLLLAGALTVALFVRPRWRAWSWVPTVAGLAVAGLQALAVAGYPEHTTGYAATFWLRDPTDASLGTIGPSELPGRIVERLDGILVQLGRAVLGGGATEWLAIVAVLGLLGAAVGGERRWRWSLAAYASASALVLAAWPYRDARFGLPLLPLAAVGAAVLIGGLLRPGRRRANRGRFRGSAVVAVAVGLALGLHVQSSVAQIVRAGAAEEEQLRELHVAMDDLERWVEANTAPDDVIASLDYRELAYRIDRPVAPIPYTSDPDALWEASGGAGAEFVVSIRGLYGARARHTDTLVSAFPDRFHNVYANDRIHVFAITPPAGP